MGSGIRRTPTDRRRDGRLEVDAPTQLPQPTPTACIGSPTQQTLAASIYLGAVGLALLLVPVKFGVDAVPEDASSELIALLRLLGGPFLGIAVLNWMSRNADPSAVRNTVILANLVGFGVVAASDVVGVASGNARDLAKVFMIVHLAFAAAFAVAWGRSRTAMIQSKSAGC